MKLFTVRWFSCTAPRMVGDRLLRLGLLGRSCRPLGACQVLLCMFAGVSRPLTMPRICDAQATVEKETQEMVLCNGKARCMSNSAYPTEQSLQRTSTSTSGVPSGAPCTARKSIRQHRNGVKVIAGCHSLQRPAIMRGRRPCIRITRHQLQAPRSRIHTLGRALVLTDLEEGVATSVALEAAVQNMLASVSA